MIDVDEILEIPSVPDSELADLISILPAVPIGEPPYLHPAFQYVFPWSELGKLVSNQGGMPKLDWELSDDIGSVDCVLADSLRTTACQDEAPFNEIPCGRLPLSDVVKEMSALWQRRAFLPGYVEPNDVLIVEALVALRRGRLGLPVSGPTSCAASTSCELPISSKLALQTPYIVELGAGGIGLPGIAAARLWRSASIVFIEREPAAWECLRENASLNGVGPDVDSEKSISSSGVTADVTNLVGENCGDATSMEFNVLQIGCTGAGPHEQQLLGGSRPPNLSVCSHVKRIGRNAKEACANLAALFPDVDANSESLALIAHTRFEYDAYDVLGTLASMGFAIDLVLEEYSRGVSVYAVRRFSASECEGQRSGSTGSSLLIRREEESGEERAFWLPHLRREDHSDIALDGERAEEYSPLMDTICAARPRDCLQT